MTNLTRFENDGIELVIDQKSGEAFATVNGYARMSGISKQAVSKRLSKNLHNQETTKTAEIDTGYGFKLVNLIPADTVFEWLIKDNPELALVMGKAGATIYMHKLAGFEINRNPVTVPSLPPADIRVCNLSQAMQYFGIEIENPRFKQAAKDLVCDILGLNQNKLNAPENSEIWLGVAERAEQLGYSISLVTSFRSTLGKFVKSHNLEFKEEKRLCNGTERTIKIYKLSEALDNVIKEYMDAKVLAS